MRHSYILLIGLGLCLEAFPHGDLHERIAAVTEQIQSDSLNGELYQKRGMLYVQHEEFGHAMADFRKALTLDMDLMPSYLGMAQVYIHTNDLDSGLMSVNVFLSSYPTNTEALQTRATLYQVAGRHELAVADLRSLVGSAPDARPEYHIDLGRAILLADPNDRSSAVQVLTEGLERFGFVISLYEELIRLSLAWNDHDSALHYMGKVIDNLDRKESWLARKAELLVVCGRHADALVAYQSAAKEITLLPAHIRQSQAIATLQSQVDAGIHSIQTRPR